MPAWGACAHDGLVSCQLLCAGSVGLFGSLLLACSGCADNPYVTGVLRQTAPTSDAAMAEFDCADFPQALACSGFESGGLADWESQVVAGEGAGVEWSAARSHTGKGALRAFTTTADSTAVVAQSFPAVTAGTLYVRGYLFIPGDEETRTINLFFVGLEPNEVDGMPFTGVDLNVEDGPWQVFSPQNFPDRVTGSVAVPRDRWFCVQIEMDVAERGAVRVFMDGAPAFEVTNFDTLPDGGVQLFRAGVDWSSKQITPFEVFMDDLVLSTAPVACD